MFWPQLGQNFEVDGICAWQFGQAIRATDMPVPLDVVWNRGGTRTMPAPNAAPPPVDFPSDAAASLTVSIRITSSGATPPDFNQNRRSRNSGVVSIPSNLRSTICTPTRLK